MSRANGKEWLGQQLLALDPLDFIDEDLVMSDEVAEEMQLQELLDPLLQIPH